MPWSPSPSVQYHHQHWISSTKIIKNLSLAISPPAPWPTSSTPAPARESPSPRSAESVTSALAWVARQLPEHHQHSTMATLGGWRLKDHTNYFHLNRHTLSRRLSSSSFSASLPKTFGGYCKWRCRRKYHLSSSPSSYNFQFEGPASSHQLIWMKVASRDITPATLRTNNKTFGVDCFIKFVL